jgi:iron(III) transport system ATP-binding protein
VTTASTGAPVAEVSPAVVVSGLRRTFPVRPPVVALDGVDLTVPVGSIVAILGPSGSGKTTLLRVLAGTDRADAGTVHVGGVLLDGERTHVPPERRKVGLVPQEGALFPHLDVAGNIGFSLNRSPRSERRARVEELLELVDLAGMGGRRPHELSGGQQQRVALARALAPGPDVVLLDEPFSALDASLRRALRAEIAELLRRTGTTAVLVTHDQDEALSMADRVAVMRDGRIVQEGTPVDIYRRPADLWVAHFVGEAVVLPGVVTQDRPTPAAPAVARCALGDVAVVGPDGRWAGGDDVLVCLRPEQIVPAGGDGAADGPGAGAAGRVRRTQFEGSDVIVELTVGDTALHARWPSTTVDVGPGDEVRLTVRGAATAFGSDPDR